MIVRSPRIHPRGFFFSGSCNLTETLRSKCSFLRLIPLGTALSGYTKMQTEILKITENIQQKPGYSVDENLNFIILSGKKQHDSAAIHMVI